MRNVKIVCTLGPATDGPDRIADLIRAGMDVARLNFSHGAPEDHRRRFQEVRAAARAAPPCAGAPRSSARTPASVGGSPPEPRRRSPPARPVRAR